ncbi:DUF6766 family protein [Streptomyces sp. NPDC091204]|uniref:DUF6766 family protein n=1 Tax=Streptomyces sp. NPDC091204 TaxID=3155299 RepID=UPI00342A5AC8
MPAPPDGRRPVACGAGTVAFNEEQLRQLQEPVSWTTYLSVYLRQRGSPESKPVGAAHAATGVES